MTSPAEMQALLRFLSHDAKVPLAAAMGKMQALQKAGLTSPALIAKSTPSALQRIFEDQKLARQIVRAAKRLRAPRSPRPVLEPSLTLPASAASDSELAATVVHTNRAPLLLAFAVQLLAVTMPAQPLAARLSVAQAAVSAASRAKATSLGIGSSSAESERAPPGQPTVRVLGREIGVLRRARTEEDGDGDGAAAPELWGLDLDSSAGPSAIHSPQSARAYLLKSFLSPPTSTNHTPLPTATATPAQNLALVLRALELLFASWGAPPALSGAELDERAWGWYVAVRPAVRDGKAGWGGKADVHLKDILALRRGA